MNCFFNERISKNHLVFNPLPNSVTVKDSSILINYTQLNDFTLRIVDSIQDDKGNVLKMDTSIFINYLNQYDLIITEIMADPDTNLNLLSDEYLELYNRSNHPLSLKNVTVCIDGICENLPETIIGQDEYLLVYPKKPLLNGGSEIRIVSKDETIHQVDYNTNWYKDAYKKSGGWALEIRDISKPCLGIKNWSATDNFDGGTPGLVNSIKGILEEDISFKLDYVFPLNDTTLKIVFNYEIQSGIALDSIEIDHVSIKKMFYNSNEITIITDRMKVDSIYNFRIHQTLNSCWKNGSLESTSLKFSLPSNPIENEIVINEILFDPDALGSDYIEILNNSGKYFNLKKLQFGSLDNYGNISDIHFLSKENRTISPYEAIAFTQDLDWIQEQFDNSGNVICSDLPACNNIKDHILLISAQGKIIDSLTYSETWHYPELNSTENISLERISPNDISNATNWFSASSSSGYGTPGLTNSTVGRISDENKKVSIYNDVIIPDNDGINDFLRVNFNMNETGWIGSIQVINSLGIVIHDLASHFLFGASDRISWNCVVPDKSLLSAGIYVLFIQMIHPESERKFNKKITFYINRKVM